LAAGLRGGKRKRNTRKKLRTGPLPSLRAVKKEEKKEKMNRPQKIKRKPWWEKLHALDKGEKIRETANRAHCGQKGCRKKRGLLPPRAVRTGASLSEKGIILQTTFPKS